MGNMRKFITNFLLICSICIFANADEVKTNTNTKKEQKQNIKKIKNNIVESNKSKVVFDAAGSDEKEILKILSSNSTKTDDQVAKLIAQKVSDDNSSDQYENNGITLSELVEQIRKINFQISILKAQKGDFNASSAEAKSISENKKMLFDKLPMAITNQRFDKKELLAYVEKKRNLEYLVEKYAKKPKSKEYISANLDLQIMEFSDIFYSALIKIEKMFIDGAKKEELENQLQKSILDIQMKDYMKLEGIKETLKDDEKNEFDEKFMQLENYKNTYEEILSYLLKNTDLLASNAIFAGLNLKQTIDYINSKIPFKTKNVNYGKIILITLIIIFFYSLRKLFARMIYFIFKIFYRNSEKNEVIKTQVIDIIKKPVGVLLIIYALDICMSIFYYPAPVPIKFGNLFSMLYTISYAWLIIKILDGFGIIVLSNLAKKSGKKEIINLIIKILYIIVIIITLLMLLKRLGFDVSALLASLGIGGFAIALATKDIIANFFSSIMLLFDNSFSQGDMIVIDDIQGTVVETGLRKTTIRTFDNALVFIPNSKIIEGNIKNWNRRKIGRCIQMNLGVTYDATAEQILACIDDIKDMLMHHPDIAKPDDNALSSNNFKLRYKQNMVSVDDLAGYKNSLNVVLKEFADSSINIYVECFTKTIIYAEFLSVRQDIMIKIMRIIAKHGLSFAFPSQSLYLEKISTNNDISKELAKIIENDKKIVKNRKNKGDLRKNLNEQYQEDGDDSDMEG